MKTTKKLSKYQIGWIGLRARTLGNARKKLIADGWISVPMDDLNNRNGFNFVIPLKTKDAYLKTCWSTLSDKGLNGIAMWISDAQWAKNKFVTYAQWKDRSIIERAFNCDWPLGRRV